jgi:hypothetical protein
VPRPYSHESVFGKKRKPDEDEVDRKVLDRKTTFLRLSFLQAMLSSRAPYKPKTQYGRRLFKLNEEMFEKFDQELER